MTAFLLRIAGDVFIYRNFRLLWGASLLAYMATWMSTVGSAWLMTQIDSRPLMVALIQTASTAPFFLLSLPAGVLADLVDRRHVMLAVQAGNILISLLMAGLLWQGILNSVTLLALSFLFGTMLAINAPAMQATVSATVPVTQLPQAVALNSISYNMARSLGPALAGLLLPLVGSVWLFLVNGVAYFFAWLAIYRLPAAPPVAAPQGLPPESLWPALWAGLRFARHSPAVHAVLLRSIGITLCGSALWALLPLLAAEMRGGSATGYGLLVTCLGGGAIFGGLLLSVIRARWSLEAVVGGGTLVFALTSALAALLHQPWAIYGCLLVGGAAWLIANAVLFTVAQTCVPLWVRARSTALVLVSFQGGMAGGALLWGGVAQVLGVQTTLLLAAGLSLPLHLLNRRFVLEGGDERELSPAPYLGQFLPASLVVQTPLAVEIRYRVIPESQQDFVRQIELLSSSRRRNGASDWQLLTSLDHPGWYVERFSMASEIAYQHQLARTTVGDQALYRRLEAYLDAAHPPQMEHFTTVSKT